MGPFLDLCAGTGAVGLEAHSRGYTPVVCVEQGEPGWACLAKNLSGQPIRPLRADIRSLGQESFQGQAVIFLDPPYELAAPLWGRLAGRLRQWISADGVLVFETDRKSALELQPGWILAETREYGAARFHFWTPA
jgi:16S rRNA (guanine966-N2)-methyltransferase